MAMGNLVFVAAGPNPRMRFKLVRCPVIEIGRITDPGAYFRAVAAHGSMEPFGTPCDREIMVFFKNIALCPLHGIIYTQEPWIEEGGTHDN